MDDDEFYSHSQARCPYCKTIDNTPHENFDPRDEDVEVECCHCERKYAVSRHVSVTYTSRPIEANDGAR